MVRRVSADGVYVPPDIASKMGLQTCLAATPSKPRKLAPFTGVLNVDPNRSSRIRSLFAGTIIAYGTPDGKSDTTRLSAVEPGSARALKVGDRVVKDQLLAIIWSKDLGEKKSELLAAIASRNSNQRILDKLKEGQANGNVPPASVWQAERAVEADRIAEEKAELTLRTWRVGEKEIASIRTEAERLLKAGSPKPDYATWARVEIRSPQDGVITEKNYNVGTVVDPTLDLFQIADLSKLLVWAHVYEEDLPLVEALPMPIPWTVSLVAQPGSAISGTLDSVAPVIDPNQHTALASGTVDNRAGNLRSGMAVSVTVEMPARLGEIEVPAAAVVENGNDSVVLVQANPDEPVFSRRKVRVVRRFQDAVYLLADPGVLKPGDRVLTSGSLLINNALNDLPPGA
jgi:cobalt-zinc-cadmium efflux system membrane fusion protein